MTGNLLCYSNYSFQMCTLATRKILLLVFFFLYLSILIDFHEQTQHLLLRPSILFLLTMTSERHLTSQANNHKQCFVTLTHMNTLISFPSTTGTHIQLPYWITSHVLWGLLNTQWGREQKNVLNWTVWAVSQAQSLRPCVTHKLHSISHEDLALYIKLVFTTNKREISIWQSVTETVTGPIDSKDTQILLYVPTTISSVSVILKGENETISLFIKGLRNFYSILAGEIVFG